MSDIFEFIKKPFPANKFAIQARGSNDKIWHKNKKKYSIESFSK